MSKQQLHGDIKQVISATPCGKCSACICFGHCTKNTFPMVTDKQLNNPEWLRDARNFTSSLAITGALWISELFDLHSRLPMYISTRVDGKKVTHKALPVSRLFLPSDEIIDTGRATQYMESLRCWCRDFLAAPADDGIDPFVTAQRREHARIALTLIAMHHPDAFLTWGIR